MNSAFITLLGGTALMIYSIEELSKSVQYLAGSKFRTWINLFTANRLSAILLGLVLSILLSSSGAVTVMLVGLANARLLTLEQVFAVTLGASIGTTLIVHLFAFNVSQYGLVIMALGVGMEAFARSDRFIRISRGILFFGMMFYSMSLIVTAGKQMENNELFNYIIEYFRNRPVISLIISAVFTAAVHSSAATIAFMMSIMVARHSDVYEAIPWVLGANLGTTTTAFFASFKSGTLGKQAALGHLFCKVLGVVVCFPLMNHLGKFAEQIGGDVSRQIATTHTLFNVFLAILFFPFITLGVSFVRKFVSDKDEKGEFSFQYLEPRTLETPELALAQAQREILRLSDIVEKMLTRSITLFEPGRLGEVESIKSMDQLADFLNKGIKLYLTKLSQKEMTPEQVQKEFELLLRTNDLENIGDIVDKNILELVKKKHKKGYVFSKEGWSEITIFHEKVVECLRVSTAYFTSRDPALAARLIVLREQIEDLLIDLSEQHVQRLHRGVKESLDTTSVHLDLLGNLEHIAVLSTNFMRLTAIKQSP
ncbi:MAG: Na/Pi cotransporter family protein [Proteobacteria bacterium]|nr:Na/Pi cotransporter family protein [Pseudomonadota bacterium]